LLRRDPARERFVEPKGTAEADEVERHCDDERGKDHSRQRVDLIPQKSGSARRRDLFNELCHHYAHFYGA
jgi:hypothetical protein